MSKRTINSDDLWTYVHGAETGPAIAEALQDQPELAAMERSIRALHSHLQHGLGASSPGTEEALISEITRAWDKEHGELRLVSPSRMDGTLQETARRPRISIWHFGMAIAACLAIVMGVQTLSPPEALVWQEITIARTRSGPETSGLYADEDVSVIQQLLSQTVATAYAKRAGVLLPRAMWTLSSSLNVRPDLSFTLIVRAENRYDAGPEKSWSHSFDTLGDYKSQISEFADDIAEGLAEVR